MVWYQFPSVLLRANINMNKYIALGLGKHLYKTNAIERGRDILADISFKIILSLLGYIYMVGLIVAEMYLQYNRIIFMHNIFFRIIPKYSLIKKNGNKFFC